MSKDLLSHIPSVSLVPENLLSLDAFAGLHSTPGSIDLQSQEEKYETQQCSKFTKFMLELRNEGRGTPKTPKGEHRHLMTTADVRSTTVS